MTDTGVGMDEATLNRIYERFFTTKKRGTGTGMGLSAVYGTMMTHGASISAESKPGQGTTFKLYFLAGEEMPIETGARHAAAGTTHSTAAVHSGVSLPVRPITGMTMMKVVPLPTSLSNL